MNKNIVAKVVRRTVIGGIVYLTIDLFYQMGKGMMLGTMLKYEVDAKRAYDLISIGGETKRETIRLKLVKFFADRKLD